MYEIAPIVNQLGGSPAALAHKSLPEQEREPDAETELPNRLPIQLKLSVGAPDDPLEYEADAMADKVMRMPETSFIQRKVGCSCGDFDDEHVRLKPLSGQITPFIQAKGDGAISEAVSGKIKSSLERGNPMQNDTKSFMESRFGVDFSNVKIHTGNESAQLNQSLNAKAFTVSNNIYFNSGQHQPETDSGKHLLAHELTHVVQQGGSGTVIMKKDDKTQTDPPENTPKSDKISDEDLNILAAIVATEAFTAQEDAMEWVYFNLYARGKNYINESTPYRTGADTYKFNKYLLDDSYKTDKLKGDYLKKECKNLTDGKKDDSCSNLKTIEDVYNLNASYYGATNKKRVQKIRDDLVAKFKDPKDNPGYNSNGNLDDINRNDGEWPRVRAYLQLQGTEKVPELVKKMGMGSSFEVVYKKDKIMEYFKDNPKKLPAKVPKYP